MSEKKESSKDEVKKVEKTKQVKEPKKIQGVKETKKSKVVKKAENKKDDTKKVEKVVKEEPKQVKEEKIVKEVKEEPKEIKEKIVKEEPTKEVKTIKEEKKETVKKVEAPKPNYEFRQVKQKIPHTGFKSFLKFIVFVLIVGVIGINGYHFIKVQDETKTKEISEKLEAMLTMENKEIEYGTVLKFSDLNLPEEIKLVIDGKEVEDGYKFDKVGEFKVVEKAEEEYVNLIRMKKTISKEKELTFSVVDTQMPVIEGAVNKEIILGEEVDLKEGITAKDPVDGELEVTIEGEVNKDVLGSYIVTATATDKNGNETSTEFIVKVVNQKSTTSTRRNITTPETIITNPSNI